MDKKVWNLRKNLKQVAKAAGFKSAHKFSAMKGSVTATLMILVIQVLFPKQD